MTTRALLLLLPLTRAAPAAPIQCPPPAEPIGDGGGLWWCQVAGPEGAAPAREGPTAAFSAAREP